MRHTLLAVIAILCLIAVACSTAPTPAPAPAAPPDTRAADMQAVKDVEAAWMKDAATKDPAKWASYFTDDGAGLYPGAPTVTGKDALKAAVTPMMADPNFALTFSSNKVVASKGGDMVFAQGTYEMTMTNPKTKKPVTDHGKYLTVYTKQADGSWKAVADTFNSDSAM
ncbi:MAG: nuclear transport factor 2 family protein [Terriglobales bacterium]